MSDIYDYISSHNRDLKSFASVNLSDSSNKDNPQSDNKPKKKDDSSKTFDESYAQQTLGSGTYDQAKELYSKYKDYSQQDLEQVFLSESKQRLKNGSLSIDKMQKTIDKLSPMLNDSQREFLSNLLGKLNE